MVAAIAVAAPGVARAGVQAYVSNGGSSSVSVIGTATHSLTATVGVGTNPSGIATTPDGSRAYVANFQSASVSVIDTATNTVIGPAIPVGVGPISVAITPDGARAYVVRFSCCASNISVIDTATNSVVATISVGGNLTSIAIAPDGTRAYVANASADSVSVIDTATNTVTGPPISVGDGPNAIAITPDGTRAYVANASADSVTVINTATNTVNGPAISVGDRPSDIAITPSGTRAYVSNGGSDSVSVIDTATNTVVAPAVAVGEEPQTVAITPDGADAFVANNDSDSLSVIDTAANTVVATVAAGNGPLGVAFAQVDISMTTLASPDVKLGSGQLTDTATLSGGDGPANFITFFLYGPDDADCSGTAVYSDTEEVNGNGAYTSDPFTPTEPGTYRWVAEYIGDANNDPVSTACNDPGQSAVVANATPAISTEASGDVTIGGGQLTDTATLPGGFNPTGTITFSLHGPDDANCSDTPVFTSIVPVSGNGDGISDPFTPTQAGTYRWIARYSGDANNESVVGACNDPGESVVVAKATPAISTEASGDVTIGGGQISDTAALAGGFEPTGKITFELYSPDDADCSQAPVFTDEVNVDGNGEYASDAFTPAASGTYRWIASYSGDANNEPAVGVCGEPGESASVEKATPELTSQASGDITLGFGQLTDAARLSGGFDPVGTITFELYGPDDPACSGAPAFKSEVTVAGNGEYTSASFTPTEPGTYRWVASYSGDADNKSVTGACNDPGQSVKVGGTPLCDGRPATILVEPGKVTHGTSGDDVIVGTESADEIYARAGGDVICARGGDDRVHGGDGEDLIHGGTGADHLRGNAGEDHVLGGLDDDELRGGRDADRLDGRAGADLVLGGRGDDKLRGGTGEDTLRGHSGDDRVFGGADDDELRGGTGDDALNGGTGSDGCDGGPGTNTLSRCG